MSPPTLKASAERLYASLPLEAESRCIRLLTIKSSGISSENRTIIGNLEVHSINETRPRSFAALSYVWGTVAAPAHRVILGNGRFHVEITSGCFNALADVVAAVGTITIWVDAICINQQDEEEKERQIPFMKDIYTLASSVYVWLGEGSRDTEEAVDYLKRVAKTRRRLPFGTMTRRKPSKDLRLIPEMFLGTCLDSFARFKFFFSPPQQPSRDAMDELLDSEWTRRAWTFQEILLARNAVFVRGNGTISWDELVRALFPAKLPLVSLLIGFYPLWPSISEDLLGNWNSMIQLWLSLPRDRFAPLDVAIPQGWNPTRRKSSFSAQVASCQRRMHRAQFAIVTIRCVFYLSALSPLGYACYRISLGAMLLVFILPLLIVARWVDAILSFIILGMKQNTIEQNDSASDGQDPDRVMLDAILTALRYRASSEPHDMIFSLLAILDALGVQSEKPSYKLTVSQTSSQFIGSLVSWNPDAVSLILDAGSHHDPAGLTWAPDWSRTPPSWWLTSRYGVAEKSPQHPTKATVEGGLLKVEAVCLGKVVFQTSLANTNSENMEEEIEGRLAAAYRVLSRTITPNKPNDELISSVFAVLEGITPPRRPTTVSSLYPPPMYGSPRTTRRVVTSTEPLYKAPYDFLDRREVFEQFQHLHNLMIGAPEERYAPKPAAPKAYLETILSSFRRDKRGLFTMTSNLEGNEDGGLIGSGPLGVEVGDEVFLISGVPTPMALRRDPSGMFQVIGAVLVHGVCNEGDERRIPMRCQEEIVLM